MSESECNADKLSNVESVIVQPQDIDRIALIVVEQIQQQMQTYEDAVKGNEIDYKQVELHIQAKRIKNILDSCLKKIELALLLPSIFLSVPLNDEYEVIRENWNHIYGQIERVSTKWRYSE